MFKKLEQWYPLTEQVEEYPCKHAMQNQSLGPREFTLDPKPLNEKP